MYKIVLIRHGESQWNLENRFCGWTDVDITPRGQEQAEKAGKLLKSKGYIFDCVFTSLLKRSIHTINIVLDEMDLAWIPVEKDWHLNERHYGNLQGLNKTETAAKFGEEQVKIWRRSYDVQPPVIKKENPFNQLRDPRYKDLPVRIKTESLKNVVDRVVPYWKKDIIPLVKKGKRIIISAHGNSLRALVKHLDGLTKEEVLELNIPTGIPLVYELDKNLKPKKHYYVGDPKEIEKMIAEVKNQGKAKQK